MLSYINKLGMVLLTLVMGGGCATQPQLDYQPRLASLEYQFSETSSAEVLARMGGVQERGEGEEARPVMSAELRVTNRSDQPLHIEASDISIVAVDLRQFPAPTLAPASPITVPARESQLVTATFPFPVGFEPVEDNLERVHLAVTLRQEGRSLTRSIMFHDVDYASRHYRMDWAPYPYWRWHTRVGVSHQF